MAKPVTWHYRGINGMGPLACNLNPAKIPKSHKITFDPRNATCKRCKRKLAHRPANQGYRR